MIQEDLFNDLYIKGVARTLAVINCLEVPINRKSNWLIGKLSYFNNKLKKTKNLIPKTKGKVISSIQKKLIQ